ncbi:CMTA1 protein, partial [Polyodon spathula]|nr:CMTA1 protein [Polyodon spathula]
CLYGCYVHSSIIPTFHRRCYWLLQVVGIPVEAIRATVFYKQRWMLLLVDTSAACAKNPSVFDGTYLSWVTPRLLSPLVLHPTQFLDKQIKMGVEGRPLDEITATSRGYQLLVNSTAVKIRIPFGAVGGYLKSHVIDNKYNQMYAIDLFLEHQWADDLWEVTQHRSFKPVRSPYLPETPYVVNNTIPSEKGFTVTLGNFKPDVELKNLTINGVPLTLPEAENRGVKIIEVKHPNGTKDFVLKVPFANPLILEQYIGDNYRRYPLNINYTLNIVPVNETYFHPAMIVCDVQDVVYPDVKSICTNTSIVFEVTAGNMDYQWELCIGEEPITPELAARRGYTMTSRPTIRIELPLFSIGYIYEDITLRGLVGKVVLILRDMKSLKEEARFEQRCPFPTKEMLVCMPNGVMSVLVVPMAPVPTVDLAKTTLLDRDCRPTEATSNRALFTFRVNTCGTRSKFYSAFPVSQSLLEPLFLQVELLNPHSLADHLILQDCWATLTPELDASPQWDLVTDGCLVTGDSYRTLFHPVPASTLTKASPHLQRLEVQAQQSSKDPAFWGQVSDSPLRGSPDFL